MLRVGPTQMKGVSGVGVWPFSPGAVVRQDRARFNWLRFEPEFLRDCLDWCGASGARSRAWMFGRICLSVRPQQQLAARPVISGIAAQRARACSRRAWPRQAAASGDGGRQQGDDDLPLLPGLYLVATPLGNLADFSLRARTVLQQSDLILAENPRHSAVLLQHYGITGESAGLAGIDSGAASNISTPWPLQECRLRHTTSTMSGDWRAGC